MTQPVLTRTEAAEGSRSIHRPAATGKAYSFRTAGLCAPPLALAIALFVPSVMLWPAAATAQEADAAPGATTLAPPSSDSPAEPGSDEIAMPPDPANQAPTIGGLSGLMRVVTGDVGSRHTFRIGLHTELFSSSDFLVQGDDNSRFIGTLAIAYTPWEYLEFFFNVRSQSNRNERPSEPGRLDPEVILALGDLAFGGKARFPIHPAIVVGGQLGLKLLNSVGGVSFDGDATSFFIGALGSFDIGAISSVPLRFHTNFGFMLDNSENLQSFGPSYTQLAWMNVEKFALGINRPRLQLKFGIDSQLRRWTKIGVMPLAELGIDVATSADSDFNRFVGTAISQDDFDGATTAWLTLGVRVNPLRGLALDLAVDVGLLSAGYGYGPPVTPWNLILGLSYAYDPKPVVKVVTRTRVQTVAKADAATQKGRVRGRAIDATTLMPIAGAVVTFPGKDLTGLSTDPDGGFLSYDFEPGPLVLMLRHPDFQPTKTTAQIERGAVTKLDVRMTAAAPRLGKINGSVVSGKKKLAVAATVRFEGPETRELSTNAQGRFTIALKPGAYRVRVTARGYGTARDAVTLSAGESTDRTFAMRKGLDPSLVKVTGRRIVIRRKIHFGSGRSALRPDAQQLLDLVVDALKSNPQIKRLRIAGHTDNQGPASYNLRLSRARAESVRDYLLRGGVPAARLEARGFGDTQPKRSNLTASGRATNRRVEFNIILK